MYATIRALLAASLLPLVACAVERPDDDTTADALVSEAAPLSASDFRGPLTGDAIREASSNLAPDAFASKWDASLESPVMFMRAYPGAYHRDLSTVAAKRFLGTEGICLGDAHPDNFGFVRINDQTRFVFNDLDDSGRCPIGADAARYFAVLRLYFDDDKLTKDVLEQYVDTVKDPSQALELDDSFVPDLDKHRTKQLAEATSGDHLSHTGEVGAPSADEKRALLALAGSHPELSRFTVQDVAALDRVSGGSGGLRRYWLLATRDGVQTILELKEAATPGVDLGRQSAPLATASRLAVLEKALWGEQAQGDYYYVQLQGARFLVRDRLTKKSVDLTSLGNKDLSKVLRAQASIMAGVHAPKWSGVKKDEIRAWVEDSSKTLAKRWKATYDDSK